MFGLIARLFGGGILDRVLDTIDKKVDAGTAREQMKADIVQTYLQTRGDYMRAGGFWLMFLFAAPLAFWFGSVVIYSIFWCAGCAYPQTWTIAALPSPLNDWAGLMIVSIFGVIGLNRVRK